MKAMLKTALAVLALVAAGAQAAGILDQAREAVSGSLSGMLESRLGVSEDQAKGGIGSVLSLASERLAAGDFDRLADAIPGASSYLDAARSLGAVTGPLENLAGLNEALSKLGISPETAARFVPAVTELVGTVGGDQARALLESALMEQSG